MCIIEYRLYDVVFVGINGSYYKGAIKMINEKGVLISRLEYANGIGVYLQKGGKRFVKWCDVIRNEGYYKELKHYKDLIT